MFGITDLTTYLLGVIAIILLPGPNSLFCLATAAKQGIKSGYQALFGIMLGDSLLILATVFGAGTLLKLYPSLFFVVKVVGGLYLAYLGLNLIKAGWQKWQTRLQPVISEKLTQTIEPLAKINSFRRALFLSLTNPKAILFFLSFFVQFVDPHYPNPLVTFLALAIILQFVSFIYLNVLILSGFHLTQFFSRQHGLASISMGVVGLLFIGFAIKLWTASI